MVNIKDLICIEADTLNTIKTMSETGQLDSLRQAASTQQIHKAARYLDVHLRFELPLCLRENKFKSLNHIFHIGCLAKGDSQGINQLSYSVMICDHDGKVARKFHFDYEPIGNRNNGEVKPTNHFQMCGELSSHQLGDGFLVEHIAHLYPHWSKPRIPSPPTSLVLLMNWLFIEFKDREKKIEAIWRNQSWQSLVRKAEHLLLKPYFEHGANFFSQHANDKKSFTEVIHYEM